MITRILSANQSDNIHELQAILYRCYHRYGMTYEEAFDLFHRSDPSIDQDRFEEISKELDNQTSK